MDALTPGRPFPLGAHWDGAGVNFAVFSDHARQVDLCLWRDGELRTRALPALTDQVWHGYLPAAEPGMRYLLRAHGRFDPQSGMRFDESAMLLDPAARGLCGQFDWAKLGDPESVGGLCNLVIDDRFDWAGDLPPATPLDETLLYEVHVKGATIRHPEVPETLRGTYGGLAAPAMLAHYRKLGVTALNLLPIQAFIDERRLVNLGLTNYWGYNPIAFSVPSSRYATGDGQRAVDEFKAMVRRLHTEGIEVILDVVFNHTAETDEAGPTLSFRGLDNAAYYRLLPGDPSLYENFSGCGNTLNLAHPRVLQLVMDSLRYWVSEMHVDGFRFDLAAILTRDSAFLDAVAQDPLLSRVKLIAEPWDLGPDGYRLGRFPAGWSEWNDRYRDGIRGYWLTGSARAGALAQRLAGSSELFRAQRRPPQAGVNFVTAHDGFTLRDLVSYSRRHNEDNGEHNRDGQAENLSTHCGIEGETDDPAVLEIRRRLRRALLATLFFSQGMPMLQAGDEIGRTQRGNNNAYCQDNEITWLDWERADHELCACVAELAGLRREFAQLRRRDWLTGRPGSDRSLCGPEQGFGAERDDSPGEIDVLWWHPDGRPMGDGDWNHPDAALAARLAPVDPSSPPILLAFNPAPSARRFALPAGNWRVRFGDAALSDSADNGKGTFADVGPHTVALLVCCTTGAGEEGR